MKNYLGLPSLPTLGSSRTDGGHATKVSLALTEQVKQVVSTRYESLKLTRRAAIEIALTEWLTKELESAGA